MIISSTLITGWSLQRLCVFTVLWENDICYMKFVLQRLCCGCDGQSTGRWPVQVRFVMDKVALGQVFFNKYFRLPPVSIIPPLLCTDLLIHFYQEGKQARLENLEGQAFSMNRRVYVHIFYASAERSVKSMDLSVIEGLKMTCIQVETCRLCNKTALLHQCYLSAT